MPHAVCWAADPKLVWTMVAANFVTFLSYFSLCVTLLFIVRRTSGIIARDWAWFVIGFAMFIVACGSTHLMDVVTTWISVFWIDAWSVIVTAILSAYVAIMLIRRAPHISFAINDYARRLSATVEEKDIMREQLLNARKLEDWGKLSAAISHEISNPLESIQNILYLLETDPDASAESASLAEQAREEVGRVITLSQSTLSFHRESASPEKIDLRSVAESVSFLLRSVIREKGIDFHIIGDPVIPVEAFPGETRQVILNLTRNACEAITKPGSRVTIELLDGTDEVAMKVTDEGAGIDPRIASKLFEFGKSTKGEKGNGIGLWTVHQIIAKHHGDISLDTQYRNGTRFVVRWPKQYQHAESVLSDAS